MDENQEVQTVPVPKPISDVLDVINKYDALLDQLEAFRNEVFVLLMKNAQEALANVESTSVSYDYSKS